MIRPFSLAEYLVFSSFGRLRSNGSISIGTPSRIFSMTFLYAIISSVTTMVSLRVVWMELLKAFAEPSSPGVGSGLCSSGVVCGSSSGTAASTGIDFLREVSPFDHSMRLGRRVVMADTFSKVGNFLYSGEVDICRPLLLALFWTRSILRRFMPEPSHGLASLTQDN